MYRWYAPGRVARRRLDGPDAARNWASRRAPGRRGSVRAIVEMIKEGSEDGGGRG